MSAILPYVLKIAAVVREMRANNGGPLWSSSIEFVGDDGFFWIDTGLDGGTDVIVKCHVDDDPEHPHWEEVP